MTTSVVSVSDLEVETLHSSAGFDAVYRREWMPMVRLAFLLTGSEAVAQEVVQDAFIELRERWDSVTNPGGYLRTSVVNRSRTAWRRESREASVDVRLHREPVTLSEPDEMWPRVRALPAGQREVVVLRFYEDLSVPQIAEVLGCRPGTVKSRLSRALAKLKGAQ